LTFFFNIDRLGVSSQLIAPLGLQSYVIAAIATMLPLLPITQQIPLFLQAAIIALLNVLSLLIIRAPLLGDTVIVQHILGLLLQLATLFLSYRVSQATAEFRKAIETITFSDQNSRLRHINEVHSMVDVEMVRSRRFERPLSLVVVQADASSVNMEMHKLVQEMQRSMMQRYVLSTMARVLSRALRRTDLVLEEGKPGRLLLLAPETNDAEARLMGQRVSRVIMDRLGISATFGAASFPQEALTFEDLRDVAEQDLQSRKSGVNEVVPDEMLALGGIAVKAPQDHETAHV
jgi:hypothetical protein